jgi:Polyketide cyclase / dehydrase and lipid transport
MLYNIRIYHCFLEWKLYATQKRNIDMGQIKVKAEAVLDARPEDVYATIADYRKGHPAILPKENLFDLQAEEGGYGAGSIIRFKSRVLGVEQSFYQRVSEPEPGRVLVEQDIEKGQNFVTTFRVNRVEEGQKSHVEISTILNASPGLKGLVERVVVSMFNPPIYRKELKLLEAVAKNRRTLIAEQNQI